MKHAFSRSIGGFQDTQFDSYVEDGGSEESPFVFVNNKRDIDAYTSNALENEINNQPKIEVIANDPKAPMPRAGFAIDGIINNDLYNFSELKKQHNMQREDEMRTLGDYITTQQADDLYDADGTPLNQALNTPDTYSSLPKFGSRKELGRYVDSDGKDATNVNTGYLDTIAVNETQAKINPEANFISSQKANRVYDTMGTPISKIEEEHYSYDSLPQFAFGKKTMNNVVKYFDAYQQRHDDLSGLGLSLVDNPYPSNSPQNLMLSMASRTSGDTSSNTTSSDTTSSNTTGTQTSYTPIKQGTSSSTTSSNQTSSKLYNSLYSGGDRTKFYSRDTVNYGGKTVYDGSKQTLDTINKVASLTTNANLSTGAKLNTSGSGLVINSGSSQQSNYNELVAYRQKVMDKFNELGIELTTDEYNLIQTASSIEKIDAIIDSISERIAYEAEMYEQQNQEQNQEQNQDEYRMYPQVLIPVYNDNGDLIGHYSDSSMTNFIPLDNQGGGQNGDGEIVDDGDIIIIDDGNGEIIEGGGTADTQKQESNTGLLIAGGLLAGLGAFFLYKKLSK